MMQLQDDSDLKRWSAGPLFSAPGGSGPPNHGPWTGDCGIHFSPTSGSESEGKQGTRDKISVFRGTTQICMFDFDDVFEVTDVAPPSPRVRTPQGHIASALTCPLPNLFTPGRKMKSHHPHSQQRLLKE